MRLCSATDTSITCRQQWSFGKLVTMGTVDKSAAFKAAQARRRRRRGGWGLGRGCPQEIFCNSHELEPDF